MKNGITTWEQIKSKLAKAQKHLTDPSKHQLAKTSATKSRETVYAESVLATNAKSGTIGTGDSEYSNTTKPVLDPEYVLVKKILTEFDNPGQWKNRKLAKPENDVELP